MSKEMVNHPAHYSKGGIECIDAMIATKGAMKTLAFCEVSVFKYNWRQGEKDVDIQEVGKQCWYADYEFNLMKKISDNPVAAALYKDIMAKSRALDKILNEHNPESSKAEK